MVIKHAHNRMEKLTELPIEACIEYAHFGYRYSTFYMADVQMYIENL